MEIQNNHELIPVLGITVDAVSVSRAVEISKTYLDNDYFNFVLLAGAQLAMKSQESKETKRFTDIANLILPGDHNVEEAIDKGMDETPAAVTKAVLFGNMPHLGFCHFAERKNGMGKLLLSQCI